MVVHRDEGNRGMGVGVVNRLLGHGREHRIIGWGMDVAIPGRGSTAIHLAGRGLHRHSLPYRSLRLLLKRDAR